MWLGSGGARATGSQVSTIINTTPSSVTTMFQSWRIQLRAAEQAWRAGRLDDAARIVSQGNLPEFLPGKQLQAKLASQMLQRGRQALARAESTAGWQDLLVAERLGAPGEQTHDLRHALVAHTLQEVDSLLAADDPHAALARLDLLESRCRGLARVRQTRKMLEKAIAGQTLSRHGNFVEAAAAWSAAALLRPDLQLLAQRRDACRQLVDQNQSLAEELHAATARREWSVVLRLASEWLESAPECATAKAAWQRAWSEVGLPTIEVPTVPAHPRARQHNNLPPVTRRRGLDGHENLELSPPGPRFLLWIDGVGGYLVCESREVVIGQPVADTRVDLPIQGDLSRQHAVIRRDGEGYVLAPRRRTQLDRRLIAGPEMLTENCEIELGMGVRLAFRRPHPLSASARLDFTSHHRTRPTADAVLLMAESLVLGPAPTSHVVCPGWADEVVIFREGQELFCRSCDALEVDGAPVGLCSRIGLNSRVAVGDRSLSLEVL